MLPIFPLDLVLFPKDEISLNVSDTDYQELLKECHQTKTPIGLVYGFPMQGDETEAFCSVGCVALVSEYDVDKEGQIHIMLKGLERFQVEGWTVKGDIIYATEHNSIVDESDLRPVDKLFGSVREMTDQFWDMVADVDPAFLSQYPQDQLKVENSYQLLGRLNLTEDGRQSALETTSVKKRFQIALNYMKREVETLRFLMKDAEEAMMVVN